MASYYIIINPISGRGAGEKSIPLLEQFFTEQKLAYKIQKTARPWHATELAQEASKNGYDVIVGVGGDGTANEIINGLMLAKESGASLPSLGILAVGRGNDFAYSMGVPTTLEEGCQNLLHGKPSPIDIGRVTGGDYPQGRYFGNGVGVGFDAVVGFEALKLTWLSGFPSYIVAALKTIFLYFHAPLVQIDYGDQSLTLPSLMVSIMNGRRMGGGFMMAPDGKRDDGLLNICIATQVSRARIFTLIPHFMRGDQATQKEIRTFQAKQVVVTALKGVLPAHADGETLCTEGKQLSIELLPQQINLICPE